MLEIRRERIVEALHQLQRAAARAPGTKSPLIEGSDEKSLSACVAYYRDLLLLENYAIINYCGFSKILKKHDKRTGYETRVRFMRVCVASQSFAHYPRLLELMKEAEALYHELTEAASKSSNLDHSSHNSLTYTVDAKWNKDVLSSNSFTSDYIIERKASPSADGVR